MVLLCSVCHKKRDNYTLDFATEYIVVLCYYRGIYCLYKQRTHLSVLLIFMYNISTLVIVVIIIITLLHQQLIFSIKLQKHLDSYKFNLSMILSSHKTILLVMWIHLEEQLVLECFPLLQKQV